MDIDSGIIELNKVMEFVIANPVVPHPKDHRRVRLEYLGLIKDALEGVPCCSGWYAWINSQATDPLYIGQSRKGKTSSLYARLKEELGDECVAFWAKIDPLAAKTMTDYYNGRYASNQKRAEKKKDTDKILWIAAPKASVGVLDVVEQKLIWKFKPFGNTDKRDYDDVSVAEYSKVEKIVRNALSE